MTKLSDLEKVELYELVRKLRKDKQRLSQRLKLARSSPTWFEAQGNKGGSYVRIQQSLDRKFKPVEGMVHLTVGESCVVTVQQDISVAGLAMVLSACRDEGFQNVVDRYLNSPGGAGSYEGVRVDADPR